MYTKWSCDLSSSLKPKTTAGISTRMLHFLCGTDYQPKRITVTFLFFVLELHNMNMMKIIKNIKAIKYKAIHLAFRITHFPFSSEIHPSKDTKHVMTITTKINLMYPSLESELWRLNTVVWNLWYSFFTLPLCSYNVVYVCTVHWVHISKHYRLHLHQDDGNYPLSHVDFFFFPRLGEFCGFHGNTYNAKTDIRPLWQLCLGTNRFK